MLIIRVFPKQVPGGSTGILLQRCVRRTAHWNGWFIFPTNQWPITAWRTRSIMIRQRTLKNVIRATGVGLHTGEKVYLTLRPAAPEQRASYFVASIWSPPSTSPRSAENVGDTRLSTTLCRRTACADLDGRAPVVGVRRTRVSTTPMSMSVPPRCRSWMAAPDPSCSCCSRPVSRSRMWPSASSV